MPGEIRFVYHPRCPTVATVTTQSSHFFKSPISVLPLSLNIEALCAAPPEALAHRPSQMPLSCPVAPATQRELHKDGGGGGVAGRARAARAPKAKSRATSCGTSSATPCAASFTCPSLMCHQRAGVGGLASGSPHAEAYLFLPLKGCVRRVLYMPALHESTATVTRPAAPTEGFKCSKSA